MRGRLALAAMMAAVATAAPLAGVQQINRRREIDVGGLGGTGERKLTEQDKERLAAAQAKRDRKAAKRAAVNKEK